MKTLLITAIAACGASQLFAELPSLKDKPWEGLFAVNESKDYRLTVSANGETILRPVYAQGKVRDYVFIPIEWGVKLTGKVGAGSELRVLPESLESTDTATAKLRKTKILGKTESGASVELTITTDRKSVAFGIRLLDAGTLDAGTAKAAIFSRVQNYYQREEDELKNQTEKFNELVKDDWVKFDRADRKKLEFGFVERVVAASPEISGPGIERIETRIAQIKCSYLFEAARGTAMHISNDRFIRREGAGDSGVPFHKGYDIAFFASTPEAAKSGSALEIGIGE